MTSTGLNSKFSETDQILNDVERGMRRDFKVQASRWVSFLGLFPAKAKTTNEISAFAGYKMNGQTSEGLEKNGPRRCRSGLVG